MGKSDDLYSMPGHLVRRLWQVHSALFAAECGALDMTSVQYAAMRTLRYNPGIDATRLSELIAFDRSTIGDVIYRLEKKGLVQRTPSEEDRRIKILALSAEGMALLEQAEPAVQRVQAQLLSSLPRSKHDEFIGMLKKLTYERD